MLCRAKLEGMEEVLMGISHDFLRNYIVITLFNFTYSLLSIFLKKKSFKNK